MLLIAGLAGLAGVALAVRHPRWATLAFVLAVALQRPLQGLLLRVAPVGIVRNAGFLKELLLAGLVVVAVRQWHRDRHRLDPLDQATLLLLALVGLYLVVPLLLEPAVDLFPRAPDGLFPRALALRADVGLFVVLLATRSLPLDEVWRRRIALTVLGLGIAAAVATVIEFLDSSTWQRIENTWLQLPRLRVLVYDTAADASPTVSEVAGVRITRAGAWTNELTIGFMIVPAMAVALVRAARDMTPLRMLVVGVLGAGVAATVTRSAFLAMLVLVVVTAMYYPAARSAQRERLVTLAALGLGMAVLIAAPSGIAERTFAAFGGEDPSAVEHANSTTAALERAISQPLGLGLGVQPITSRDGAGAVTAENAYLQTANELGLMAMLLQVLVLWLLFDALRRRGDPMATGLAGAVAGFAMAGLFLHVWISLDGPWVLMLLAGLWLPRSPAQGQITPPARGARVPAAS